MNTAHDTLSALHILNQWIIVIATAGALGLAVAAMIRPRPYGRLGRHTLITLVAALTVQAATGVGIAITASSDNRPFDDSTATLISHALGGVLAIALISAALVRSRNRPTVRARARTAAAWTAAAAVAIGSVLVIVTLAGLVVLVQIGSTPRRRTGTLAVGKPSNSSPQPQLPGRDGSGP